MKNMKKSICFLFNLLFVLFSGFSQSNFSVFKIKDKYGLIDQDRQIILPAEYSEISINKIIIAKGNFLTKVFNENAELIVQYPKVQKITQVSDNYIQVKKQLTPMEELEIIRDEKDTSIYNYILNLSNEEKYYVKDQFVSGNEDDEKWFASKSSYYSKESNFGEKTDNYFSVYPFKNKRAVIWDSDGVLKIIDDNFNVILSNIHACAETFSEGVLPVVLEDGKSGFVNYDGEFVINCDLKVNYRMNGNKEDSPVINAVFRENRAIIETSTNTKKIIDENGKNIDFPNNYHLEADYFSNGRLPVSTTIDGCKKFGFIDINGNLVIPFDFTYAEAFVNNYAVVRYDYKDAVIDAEGRIFYVNNWL